MSSLLKLALLSLVIIFVSVPVFADDFDCLRKLNGGSVMWDMDWQRDLSDNNVIYRIVRVTESNPQKNLHEIALELLAEGPAKFPKRISRIRMEHAALLFCARAHLPGNGDAPKIHVRSINSFEPTSQATPFSPKELPFKVFAEGRWIPARYPKQGDVKVCVTKHSLFSCSSQDQLKLIKSKGAAELEGRGKLAKPFIRFREGGWVRGSEADLLRLGNSTICEAIGKKFSCLEEEKNSYNQQLSKLALRLAEAPSK